MQIKGWWVTRWAKPCFTLSGFLLLFLFMAAATAATPAGTVISNQASLSFQIGAGPALTQQTNLTSFQVLQLLDVTVQAAEAGPVVAGSPDLRRSISFLVTNVGNGPDQFRLSRVDNLPGDQFDPRPSTVPVYIENGLAPGLQLTGPQADVVYVPGSNDLVLNAGEARRVYLLSDFPANLPNAAQGRSRLIAESTLAGAAGGLPGVLAAAERIAGVSAVIGASRARGEADWAYQISGVMLRVDKQLTRVRDPQGNTSLVPGSVLTYRIRILIEGQGTASNLEFTDPLPAQTRFVPGSLRVSGQARSDVADADNAEFDGTQVIARLGNLSAPAQVEIEFEATLN